MIHIQLYIGDAAQSIAPLSSLGSDTEEIKARSIAICVGKAPRRLMKPF
jgi:hypothetical protein